MPTGKPRNQSVAAPRPRALTEMPFCTVTFMGECVSYGLTRDETGCYMKLQAAFWTRRGPIPDDPKVIALTIGCTPGRWLKKVRPKLDGLFQYQDGLLRHERLEALLAKTGIRLQMPNGIDKIYAKKDENILQFRAASEPETSPESAPESPSEGPELPQKPPSASRAGAGAASASTSEVSKNPSPSTPPESESPLVLVPVLEESRAEKSNPSEPPRSTSTSTSTSGSKNDSGKGKGRSKRDKWQDPEERNEYALERCLPFLPGETEAERAVIAAQAEDPRDPDHDAAVGHMLRAAKKAGVGWKSPEYRRARR